MNAPTSVLDLRAAAREAAIEFEYDESLRERALANWRGRMVNEFESHRVFAALAPRVREAGFGDARALECEAFAREEQRHGVLCGAVVHALGGEAVASVAEARALPLYADVSTDEAVARHVLSVCCLSETVAVSLVGAERLELPDGALRELLTEIYADEVGHARFGWRFVAEVSGGWSREARQRLSRYLAVAFGHLERHELDHISATDHDPGAGGRALGLCNGSESRGLFYDTVREVIVPGLERVGLAAAEAWERRRLV